MQWKGRTTLAYPENLDFMWDNFFVSQIKRDGIDGVSDN